MIVILIITIVVVVFKVNIFLDCYYFKTQVCCQVVVIDKDPDPNISTFRPLDQMINSNIKYNGNGYMPCNGYVPCQPAHLRPDLLAERIDGAMPCHDYKGERYLDIVIPFKQKRLS